MLLEQPEKLAEDLERGLGEIHWMLKGLYPNLRLRTEGVCGVSSLALAQHLTEQGYEVDLVISSPKLSVDAEMQHVMPIVFADGNEGVIDTSYSQFLAYAGMTPGYVMFGGKNMFPEHKVEIITNGDTNRIVATMAEAALTTLHNYEPIEDLGPRVPEFTILEEDEIVATYASIWDPAYFDIYYPTDMTRDAGKRLAEYILPEHVRLIA